MQEDQNIANGNANAALKLSFLTAFTFWFPYFEIYARTLRSPVNACLNPFPQNVGLKYGDFTFSEYSKLKSMLLSFCVEENGWWCSLCCSMLSWSLLNYLAYFFVYYVTCIQIGWVFWWLCLDRFQKYMFVFCRTAFIWLKCPSHTDFNSGSIFQLFVQYMHRYLNSFALSPNIFDA